jgi:hypothetical protein
MDDMPSAFWIGIRLQLGQQHAMYAPWIPFGLRHDVMNHIGRAYHSKITDVPHNAIWLTRTYRQKELLYYIFSQALKKFLSADDKI